LPSLFRKASGYFLKRLGNIADPPHILRPYRTERLRDMNIYNRKDVPRTRLEFIPTWVGSEFPRI
jgi:hypothetical protein